MAEWVKECDFAVFTGAANDPDGRVAALRAKVEAWQANLDGRQFLLPPYKAAPLMRSRNDYLAGTQ